MAKTVSKPGPGRPPNLRNPHAAITNAAAALFATKGYETTTLSEVAEAVGVTKAGLYHYFPSKEDLFNAIALDVLSDLLTAARERVAGATTPEARLKAFMTSHAAFFEANRDRYRAAFIGRGGDMRDFTPEQLAARRAYTDFLATLLEEGRQAGAFVFADAATTARGILGMVNWMARWYRPGGRQTAVDITEDFATTLIGGLRKP